MARFSKIRQLSIPRSSLPIGSAAGRSRVLALVAAGVFSLALSARAQAQDPGTVLYATDAGIPGNNGVASNLYTIDIETADATLIGPLIGPQTMPRDGTAPVVSWATANSLVFSYGGPRFINDAPRLLAIANPPPVLFQTPQPWLISVDPNDGSVTSEGPPLPLAEYYPSGPQSTAINQRNVPQPPVVLPPAQPAADPLPLECRNPQPACTINDVGRFDPLNVLFGMGLCSGADPDFLIIFQEPANSTSQPQDQCTYRERVGQAGIVGLAQAVAYQPGSSGTFFASNFDLTDSSLYTVDPFTGIVTEVPGSSMQGIVRSLDFHPVSGELFAAQVIAGQNFLSIVDPATGTAMQVGEVLVDGAPLPFELRAIAFSPYMGCPGAPLGREVRISPDVLFPPTIPCRVPNSRGSANFAASSRGNLTFSGDIGLAVNKDFVGNPVQTDAPTNGTAPRGREYRMCLYQQDPVLGGQRLIAAAQLPGGSNWVGTRSGYRYRTTSGLPDGVVGALLQGTLPGTNTPGRGQLRIQARDFDLPLPLENSTLFAQFSDDRGLAAAAGKSVLNQTRDCFGAAFSNPSRNDASGYRANSD